QQSMNTRSRNDSAVLPVLPVPLAAPPRAAERARLTLVVEPVGDDNTSLVDVCARLQDLPTVHLALSARDGDPRTILTRLIAQLRKFGVGIGDTAARRVLADADTGAEKRKHAGKRCPQ